MQLSKKQKTFFGGFYSISEMYIKLWAFCKKVTLIAYGSQELRTANLSKEVRFRISFDSQHTKHPQTLLKFARQHLYQIFLSFWGKWG